MKERRQCSSWLISPSSTSPKWNSWVSSSRAESTQRDLRRESLRTSLTCWPTVKEEMSWWYLKKMLVLPTEKRVGDAVHLALAAQIVCHRVFEGGKSFNALSEGYQEEYVPSMLLALVSMILEGSKHQGPDDRYNSAALEIAQMLKFNSVKHGRVCDVTAMPATVRHSVAQETPVPVYHSQGIVPWNWNLPLLTSLLSQVRV